MAMGASVVKWTTHDPCLVLSESDSTLYTNFEYCEEKNLRNLKTINLQNQAIYDDKNPHILEDGASGVQVGDIEPNNCLQFFWNNIKLH